MPVEILMPALSPTMEEGTLSKWVKKEGDKVTSGDVIAEIETDKATMEVEAVDEGVTGKILIAEGTEGVKVIRRLPCCSATAKALPISVRPRLPRLKPRSRKPRKKQRKRRRLKTSLLPAFRLLRRLKSLPIRIFRQARKWFR